jgi:cytochrome c6
MMTGQRALRVLTLAVALTAGVLAASPVVHAFDAGASAKIVGNPTVGKRIFRSVGCRGCHTLKAAGATGVGGPNLDQAKPAYTLVVQKVTNGGDYMPSFSGRLSAAEIRDVAAFVYDSTHPAARR